MSLRNELPRLEGAEQHATTEFGNILLAEQDRGFVNGIRAFTEARRHGYNAKKVSMAYFEEYSEHFPIVRSTHLREFAALSAPGDKHRRAELSRFINGLFRAGYVPIMFGSETRPRAVKEELNDYFRYRVDSYKDQLPLYEPVLRAERIYELSQQDELLLSCKNIGQDGLAFFKTFCEDIMPNELLA
ncbi:MAG: hypothetical protein ABIR37_01950 [Candidatus Saccharimonadales bacterium]